MNLVDQHVRHDTFGDGVIVRQDGSHIVVRFAIGNKTFVYPDVFEKFLTACTPSTATAVMIALQKKKAQTHIVLPTSFQPPQFEDPKLSKRKTIQYHFVFQNKTYTAERDAGILWAPKSLHNGHRVSHWDRVADVHKGDVIIHSVKKEIVAFSIAETNGDHMIQPDRIKLEKLWSDDGWGVHCRYVVVQNPVVTSDYMVQLLDLQPDRYAPFNCKGRGNTGYLFAANLEMAQLFFSKSLKRNAYLKQEADALGLAIE